MQANKIIKKDVFILVCFIILLTLLVIGSSYSYFMSIDKGQSNVISIGDLRVSFCVDETCNNNYANFGQVIGTKVVDGKSVIDNIYPYSSDEEALNTYPYIFNIKNIGTLKTYVTVRLKEDKDYEAPTNYTNLTNDYSNYIKVAVNECNNKINRENPTIYTYSELNDNVIILDDVYDNNTSKTYCLWTYLDKSTPNEVQNTYFVANLSFKAEFKPEE